MQNLLNKYNIVIVFILTSLMLTSCQHDHSHDDHGHSHGEADHDEEHDDGHKNILLNPAQYKNAEIDTGWFDKKNLTDVIHANGYTKLDPQDQAEVSMPVSGTIKSIEVIEGDYVKKGAVLAYMSSLDYSKMILENNALILERNKLLLEKAALSRERSQIDQLLKIAESNKLFLQKEYDRQLMLFNENINAKKLFEKVSNELDIERVRISSLNEQLNQIDHTLNMFSNDNRSFEQLNFPGVNKNLQLNEDRSERIPIIAPISGYITDVEIKIGENVSKGNAMFSLVDNSKMHVDLLVYEKDLNKVKVGQKVRFILTNQRNQEISGEIYNIGKSFENETKTVAVHADIEENNENLIPGMYINALIGIGTKKVNVVPEEAVVMAEGREFIFLWEKSNEKKDNGMAVKDDEFINSISFKRLEVKTGSRQLGFVELTPLEQIEKGDKIVRKGAYYLQSHLQKMESGGGHSH